MSVDKLEFLGQLNTAWGFWHGAFTGSINISGKLGDRSLKDIIAHVSWAVLETNGMLAAKGLVGSHLWRLSEVERNEVVYQENKNRTLPEVVAEAEAAQRELVSLVEGKSEVDLQSADWFAGLPGEFPPWRVIQVNVIDHYLHHAEDVRSLPDTG